VHRVRHEFFISFFFFFALFNCFFSLVVFFIFIAGIRISVKIEPENGVDVQFQHNIETNGTFTLDDDETDTTHSHTIFLTPDAIGEYEVDLPSLPLNYHLDTLECDDEIELIDDTRIVLDFQNNTIVTCTYTLVGNFCCFSACYSIYMIIFILHSTINHN